MKVGTVALIGRPNTGKSTLVNNLVGHKVAITSPKPQTTQFPIFAVFEDERGQIIFVDTPGIFAKTKDENSKRINLEAQNVLRSDVDVILYIVDHTRPRGFEENRVLGIIRSANVPKILVVNKIDIKNKDYMEEYKFMEDEFDSVVGVSALREMNLNALLTEIFNYLPEGERLVETESLPVPALNLTSKLYIEELIREKAFLFLRDEVPYVLRTVVDEIDEREDLIFIKARIITRSTHYKKMIIGQSGRMIKEIGMAARKELETSTGRKVYLELIVEAD